MCLLVSKKIFFLKKINLKRKIRIKRGRRSSAYRQLVRGPGVGGAFHLCGRGLQRSPVEPRKHVDDELRIDFDFVLRQLRVLGVQRKAGRCGLACLDGASEEIYAEHLHFCAGLEWGEVLAAAAAAALGEKRLSVRIGRTAGPAGKFCSAEQGQFGIIP